MKILGIDTSSKYLSLALSNNKGIIIERSHLLERKHSSLLIPKIKEMLEKTLLSINDIDVFIVGLGPGSFTGLRIGVSTVKGFGVATKKPCVGVPSIDAMALGVDTKADLIVPIIDAKREQVYSAIYRKKKDEIIRISEFLLSSIDKLMKRIKGQANFLGDGLVLYKEKIQLLNKKAVFLDEAHWYPRADNLIKVASMNMGRFKTSDIVRLKPLYLYPKECQIKV